MKRDILIAIIILTNIFGCMSGIISKKINIIDSLEIKEGLGEIIEQKYYGEKTDTTYSLTLYYQKHSGNKVYSLAINTDTTYGKCYTLRGDATNINATVYELKPYDKASQIKYFLKQDSSLVQLNKELETLNLILKN